MTALPRALAPWAKELAIFELEPALVLGDMALRFSTLLGAPGAADAPAGTPDGFSGIARRGSYERLLISEWLLQEELPDEFVRRVTAGEHAFLERAYASAPEKRRSVVLFDAGGDQLGAPRVMHLAALVAFARRAAERNVSLSWGILQDESTTIHEGVSKVSVLALMKGRSRRRASRADFERWRRATEGPDPDLWFVGAEQIEDAAREHCASLVVVSENAEPGARPRLHVQVRPREAARPRGASFDLPAPGALVRLLRDPFDVDAAQVIRADARSGIDPDSNLVFSSDGRRLHARGYGGSVLTFHVPNSPKAAPSRPAVFVPPSGQRVLAIGQARAAKRTLVATTGEGAVFVHRLSRRAMTTNHTERFELPPEYVAEPSEDLQPLGALRDDRVCYLDGAGRRIELSKGCLSVVEGTCVKRSKPLSDGLAYVRMGPPREIVVARDAGVTSLTQASAAINSPSADFDVHFGRDVDVVAYRRSSTWWALSRRGVVTDVHPLPEQTVVGIVEPWGTTTAEPGLVVLDETRTKLIRLVGKKSEVLLTAPEPIAFATVNDSRNVAYVTRSGELGVYSCERSGVVLRVTPGTS